MKKEALRPPIYVVSGGRGLTGSNMVQALLVQYPENNIPVIVMSNVNDEGMVMDAVMKAKADGGLIAHTMVNPYLRTKINELCGEYGVRVIDFMGDLANYLDTSLKIRPLMQPGLYRERNQRYFDRIESIEFTLSQDDGMSPDKLQHAEIILTGVSRAGKTPLSVYLAMFGWRVANVPLVNGIAPPPQLFEVDRKRVFGLHIGVHQLIAHRQKRLDSWNHVNESYVDEKQVREEIRNAMFVFDKGGFTVLNVNNKPIESTANEILKFMSERFEYGGHKVASPYNENTDEKLGLI